MATQPPEEIAAAVGSQEPDVWGYVLIAIVVFAAAAYLARQFMPSCRKSCCSNCGSAEGCVAPDLAKPRDSEPNS